MAGRTVITRFPPSPTGPFHVGSARTALFNFLFAKRNKGKFLLRIEDTDKERSRPEYEKNVFDSLSWLGFDFDGEVLRQSEKTEIYKKKISELVKNGLAYISEEKEGQNREVVRFRNPGGRVKFNDLIRGEVEMDVGELGDFIIARNLNEPLYHIAVVVDDMESGVTHVIRGEDHISNTPRQILLLEALGGERPAYAHLPLILAEDRSKLSKRKHGESVSLDFYRKEGYLPEAMVNFLALLGWNPGDNKEIFSKEELIKEFSLKKVQKSGAIFDIRKLDWMNGEYIRKKSVGELTELCIPYLTDFLQFPVPNDQFSNNYIEKVVALEQPRLKKLSEIGERTDYFFRAPEYDAELLRWKSITSEEILRSLEFSEKIIKSKIKNQKSKIEMESVFFEAIEEKDKGEILWPLRAALSGKKASPGPFEIMEILGVEETLKRLKRAKEIL